MGQMYGELVGERSRIAARPRDSHGIQTSIMLGAMLPLVAGDIAETDAWMARTLPLALNLISPWAGEEGGFANGSAYSIWGMGDTLLYFYVLRSASTSRRSPGCATGAATWPTSTRPARPRACSATVTSRRC
jgi:hypothetical protein